MEEAFRMGNIPVRFESVGDGDQLLEKLKICLSDSFDLLLIDCHLPRRSAQEVLAHLLSSGRRPAIPVAVLTSYAGDAERRELISLGANAVLSKPFDLAEYVTLARQLDALMRPASTNP